MNSGLTVRNLNAFYGRARALFDVSLDVQPGEAVALLGRNGAGKSTTFRAILGLLKTRSGELSFANQNIARLPTHEIVRLGLGYVPEDRRIFSDLTVAENLSVGRRPPRPGVSAWTPQKLFELFPNLGEMRARPGALMSGGEQQMLAIARTLIGNPSLLLLDEPSEGLAPRIVEQMMAAIQQMKREGLGMLIAEQNLAFARLVAERVYVIEKGALRFSGSMAEFDAAPDVRDAYLAL
jgi:branched-chain amino acid transport system ATP-binding protein